MCFSLTRLLCDGPAQDRCRVDPAAVPVLTEEAMFFSFFWRVESPLETSSRVVVPCWEPQAMRQPLSCTRRQKRASSHTCWRVQADPVVGKQNHVCPINWHLGRLSPFALFKNPP